MKFYETPVAEISAFATSASIMIAIDDVFEGNDGDDTFDFGSLQ